MGTTTANTARVLPLQAPSVELETKSANTAAGVNVIDEQRGIVETFVSVTGISDRVSDVIVPGAYAKTLKARTPKGILNHDWATPVSKVLEIEELSPGHPTLPQQLPDGSPWPKEAGALRVKAQYNLNTNMGRDAYENAKFFGSDQEWSIGFNVPKGGAEMKDGIRYIKELELYEFSQVLWGAMPSARTQKVKDAHGAGTEDPDESEDPSDDGVYEDPGTEDTTAEVDDEQPMDPDDDDEADWGDELVGKSLGMELTEQKALAIEAFKSVGAFLHSVGVLDEEFMVKVDDVEDSSIPDMDSIVSKGLKYETLAEAVEDIAGESMEGDELDSLVDLATKFDEALDSDDEDQITEAEGALVDALKAAIESAEGDTSEDLQELAQVLGEMVGVNGDDDEEVSDEDDSEESAEATEEQTGEDPDAPADADASDKHPELVAAGTKDVKRAFTSEQREDAADKGDALPDGSFPIKNKDDLMNAIKACGRAKDKAAAKKHIVAQARKLKLPFLIPKGWAKEVDNMKSDVVQIDASEFDLSEFKSLLGE